MEDVLFTVCPHPLCWIIYKSQKYTVHSLVGQEVRESSAGKFRVGEGLFVALKSILRRGQTLSSHDEWVGIGLSPKPFVRHQSVLEVQVVCLNALTFIALMNEFWRRHKCSHHSDNKCQGLTQNAWQFLFLPILSLPAVCGEMI